MTLAALLTTVPHLYHVVTSPTSMPSDLAQAHRSYSAHSDIPQSDRLMTRAPRHAHSAHAAHTARAKAAPPRTSASSPTPSAQQPAGEEGPASPAPVSSPSHQPTTTSSRPGRSTPAKVTCSGSGGMLPANYQAIVAFLMTHGYTGLAAAGIAGNIYRESTGNPESVGTGGGGLIGWTPLPSGFVTGNPSADLQTQLQALLKYNQQWAQYIPALNAATSATQAADIYMNDFERPGVPAAYEREGAAVAVANACHL